MKKTTKEEVIEILENAFVNNPENSCLTPSNID